MHRFAIALLTGALLAGSLLATGEARAELEVKRSSVPGMKVGDKVADEKRLSVPAGAEVEFRTDCTWVCATFEPDPDSTCIPMIQYGGMCHECLPICPGPGPFPPVEN